MQTFQLAIRFEALPPAASASFGCVSARRPTVLRLTSQPTAERFAPRRFRATHSGSRFVMLYHLKRGVNVNMCIAVQHIDCIVFWNLLEMNDVPEIPAYDESNVNPIILSSDDLAQLCEAITTEAAQFQDAASTEASHIQVPGSPPPMAVRSLASKPALP